MSLRLRVTSLLAKIEGSYGVDPVATGAANAILLRGEPTLTPMEMTEVDRDLVLPYFGNSESLPGAIYGMLNFKTEQAGPGTAGTVPAWGPLMRGVGCSETILAAAYTGTAQAGGSTTTIKLAAAASAVNEFYNGMPISITAGTGNGQSGFIVDYDGTTKIATVISASWIAPDATSAYSIGANVTYRRITDNPESIALYMNIDGVLHKFLGARGNVSGGISIDQIPEFNWSFKGLFVPIVDAASPTVVVTGWKTPVVANKANTPFVSLHGFNGAAVESYDFDLGNEINYHGLINSTEQILITNSKPSGNISMEAVNVATKDWWTIAKNATLGSFGIQHGTVAGNRIAITHPAVQIKKPSYGNKNGIAMLKAGLVPKPVSGNDEICICTF